MAATEKLDAFLKMLDAGQDGPMLRYSIGLEYLHADRFDEAAQHLGECLSQSPDYSAAYKALAEAQDALGDSERCRATLDAGIERAEANGDLQAKKEMEVYRKRLDKGKPLRNR